MINFVKSLQDQINRTNAVLEGNIPLFRNDIIYKNSHHKCQRSQSSSLIFFGKVSPFLLITEQK